MPHSGHMSTLLRSLQLQPEQYQMTAVRRKLPLQSQSFFFAPVATLLHCSEGKQTFLIITL